MREGLKNEINLKKKQVKREGFSLATLFKVQTSNCFKRVGMAQTDVRFRHPGSITTTGSVFLLVLLLSSSLSHALPVCGVRFLPVCFG